MFPVPTCGNPRYTIDNDARKRVFLFDINERIRKVIDERTSCSFRGTLSKIPVISQTIAGFFSDRVRYEDDLFDGDREHSDVYTDTDF